MGATTTEGTGFGSAPVKKREERSNLGVNRLVGPRVVVSGIVTLKERSEFVSFPAHLGSPSDYCVLLTGTSQTTPYLSRPLSVNDAGGWQFELTAGDRDVVHYAVIKIGLA